MNNDNEVLSQMNKLVTANTKAVSILGMRANVLGKVFNPVLPQLTALQCVEVDKSFRQGVEDAMSSLNEDVAFPAEYLSALLESTNSILAAVSRESAVRQ